MRADHHEDDNTKPEKETNEAARQAAVEAG
jgi:hypothetical protein